VTGLHRTAAAPPVRAVHLGLGGFFRAHQAWYTDRAGDDWGIAAFTGRRPDLARALAAQDGLYTLVRRGADGDEFDVVGSVARAHAADEHDAWLRYCSSPDVRVVTVTVTEAGYRPDAAYAHSANQPGHYRRHRRPVGASRGGRGAGARGGARVSPCRDAARAR